MRIVTTAILLTGFIWTSCNDLSTSSDGVKDLKVPSIESKTFVVLLGSGTPSPDPYRSGPCVAIVTGDNAYLVDAGPGLVRRATYAHIKGILLHRGSEFLHSLPGKFR